jgi:hypothetical protein
MTILQSLIYDFLYKKQKLYKEKFTSLEGLEEYLKYFKLEPTQEKINKSVKELIRTNYIIKDNNKYSINKVFYSVIELEPTKLYIIGFKSLINKKRTNEDEELRKFLGSINRSKTNSNSVITSIRMPNDLLKKLNEISNKSHRSKNEIIVSLIEEYINRQKH